MSIYHITYTVILKPRERSYNLDLKLHYPVLKLPSDSPYLESLPVPACKVEGISTWFILTSYKLKGLEVIGSA
jgi:hypothetical protein